MTRRPPTARSAGSRWAIAVVVAAMGHAAIVVATAPTASAQAFPSSAVTTQCMDSWIADTNAKLATFKGNINYERGKRWFIHPQYGILQGKFVHSNGAPDDLRINTAAVLYVEASRANLVGQTTIHLLGQGTTVNAVTESVGRLVVAIGGMVAAKRHYLAPPAAVKLVVA